MESLLNETLREMPSQFTSNLFNKKAIKKGVSKDQITDHTILAFLKENCNRGNTIREWKRKTPVQTSLLAPDITEDQAISFLKSKGYRISKMVEV